MAIEPETAQIIAASGESHLPASDALSVIGTTPYTEVVDAMPSLSTAASDVILKPAAGHTQPFWGTPDPYLTAGSSIAPPAKNLADMGVAKTTELSSLPEQVQIAASKGWKILEYESIKTENLLPGFSPTGGILSAHNTAIPAETPETFAAQVEWAANFLNVVDKLPYAALAYAFVEFFILRPGIDLYKEDVEEEPSDVLAETIVTTGVRMGAFCLVAISTLGIFG